MSDFFKVGDVVVCVDDRPPNNPPEAYLDGPPRIPKLHSINRISGTMLAPNKELGVLINGWPPAKTYDGFVAYKMDRFRHLPKADDTFVQLMCSLKPARTKESAP